MNPNSNQTTMKLSLVLFVGLVVLALLIQDSMAKDYCAEETVLEKLCSRCKQATHQQSYYDFCCTKDLEILMYCAEETEGITDN